MKELVGKIKRINLKNFITYSDVTITPGLNMNMIIGSNGSGKSSILCAICLGLGGKPKSIGRSTHVGEYVKTGCTDAEITIELYDIKDTVIITRHINKAGGKTVWEINGKQSSGKEVEALANRLHIQMDNLCQFLSQERVQDFSKMDAKNLLLNTERTVGSQEMTKYHSQLIDMCKNMGSQKSQLDSLLARLNRETQECETLKKKADLYKKRMDTVEKIKLFNEKKPWIIYHEFTKQVEELKNLCKIAQDELKEKLKEFEPLEREIANLKKKNEAINNSIKSKGSTQVAIEKEIKDLIETIKKDYLRIIEKNRIDLLESENAEKKRLEDLRLLQVKIRGIQQQYDRESQEFDKTSYDENMSRMNKESAAVDGEYEGLNKQKVQCYENRKNIQQNYSALEREKADASKLKDLKWELINREQNYVNASKWALSNERPAGVFKGRIYPSLYLNITLLRNANDGRYLEHLISHRDKIALFVEDPDDTQPLMNYLQQKYNIKVNILSTPQVPVNIDNSKADQMRSLGFDYLLSELFDAPEPIKKYICYHSRVNTIPIAKNDVDHNLVQARGVTCYFATDFMYRVNKSKYSQNISTKQITITRNNSYIHSMDTVDMDVFKHREAELKNELAEIEKSLKVISDEMKIRDSKKEELRQAKQTLTNKFRSIKLLEGELTRLNSRFNLTNKPEKDLDAERKKFADKKQQLLNNAVNHFPNFPVLYKKMADIGLEINVLKAEFRIQRQKSVELDQQVAEMRANTNEQERRVEELKQDHERKRVRARALLKEAKETCGFGPDDPRFAVLQQRFQDIPDTIEELDTGINEMEARMLAMTPGVDKNIIELHAKKVTEVEKLQSEYNNLKDDVDNADTKLKKIRDKWLPELEKLVENISKNFSKLFKEMKCEGEVVLVPGSKGEHDYENYGFQIRVKFRPDEPFRELSGSQSGGERSVSTAIYLLALQELTDVPFRCMDEINQGMDPTNERRIMTLMMKLSESPDSCQYFVVTPKLLTKLSYARNCKVLCVFQPRKDKFSTWKREEIMNRFRIIYANNRTTEAQTSRNRKKAVLREIELEQNENIEEPEQETNTVEVQHTESQAESRRSKSKDKSKIKSDRKKKQPELEC